MKWDSEVFTSSYPVQSKHQLSTSVDTSSLDRKVITEVSPHTNSTALRGSIKNSSTECYFFFALHELLPYPDGRTAETSLPSKKGN